MNLRRKSKDFKRFKKQKNEVLIKKKEEIPIDNKQSIKMLDQKYNSIKDEYDAFYIKGISYVCN